MRDIGQETLLFELSALRPDLERRGVLHVALFGSRARGDNRADSDVDLMIEVDEHRKFSLLDLVGVAQRIEESLGIPANLFVRRSLDPSFLAEIRREQIGVF